MLAAFQELYREASPFWQSADTQWIVMTAIALHALGLLIFHQLRAETRLLSWGNSDLWQLMLLVSALFAYAFHYAKAAWTTDALVLVSAIAAGQVARLYVSRAGDLPGAMAARRDRLSFVLLMLLAAASRWPSAETKYTYHGHLRWTGPCDNPNTFGLLMGVGLILVLGSIEIRIRRLRDGGPPAARTWTALGLLIVAGGLLVDGWVHSYSRGAWLGTAGGALIWWGLRHPPGVGVRPRSRRWLGSLAVAVAAVAVLVHWHGQPGTVVLNRVYSVANANDFSSRNRTAAMVGALQIMGDHFWLGAGWNRPEPLYETYYGANLADGGMAIQMNSCLLLGASLGVPALAAWLLFLGASAARALADRAAGARFLGAAAVVMIGFVFDGALQYLPTALAFWILLESGAVTERSAAAAMVSRAGVLGRTGEIQDESPAVSARS